MWNPSRWEKVRITLTSRAGTVTQLWADDSVTVRLKGGLKVSCPVSCVEPLEGAHTQKGA